MDYRVEWHYLVYDSETDEDRQESAQGFNLDTESLDDAVKEAWAHIKEDVAKNHYQALGCPSGIYDGKLLRIYDSSGKVVYPESRIGRSHTKEEALERIWAAVEHDKMFGHLSDHMADWYDNEIRSICRE